MAGGQAVNGAQRGATFRVSPEALSYITDPRDPLYDERVERPLTDALVESLDLYGNGKAILVRNRAGGTVTVDAEGHLLEGELQIVDGRRRKRGLEAANLLRKKRGEPLLLAKIEVIKATDRLALAMSQTFNEHHEGDDVMTKARKAQRALGQLGSISAVAREMFQCDVQTVEGWLKCLDTVPAVQQAVVEARVSPSAAAALAGLPKPEQAAKLEELLAAGPVTEKVARAAVRARKGGKTGEDAHPAPSKGVVRSVLPFLPPEDQALVKWILDGGKPPAVAREALKDAKKAEKVAT